MIAVDTSVWVSVLRSPRSPWAEPLRSLIDADEVLLPVPVRLELLAGTSRRDRAALRTGLSALLVAYPTDATWQLMDGWTDRTAGAGVTFGVADLLIAAIAHEAGALVWSLDGAFERLSRLGLIGVYQP